MDDQSESSLSETSPGDASLMDKQLIDRELNGERIVLDGRTFTRCRFIKCTLVFEGTDSFAMADCSVSNDTGFTLEGYAKLTMQSIHSMLHSTGWTGNVAKNLLGILQQPPTTESAT